MHPVIVVDDSDQVVLVPAVTHDAQSVAGDEGRGRGFGVGDNGCAAGDGFGYGDHVQIVAGVHQQGQGAPQRLGQTPVGLEAMEDDLVFNPQPGSQLLQFLPLVAIADDVEPIILIPGVGHQSGKLGDNAVHPFALHQLRHHDEGFVVLVAGIECMGIGAVVHNHIAHPVAVVANECSCRLTARHHGHVAHHQWHDNAMPKLGRQLEQQALVAVHLLPDEEFVWANARSDQAGNLECFAGDNQFVVTGMALEPRAHASGPWQQAWLEQPRHERREIDYLKG